MNQYVQRKADVRYRRRYVYPEVYDEVMDWGYANKLRTPNQKENFSFALQQYINHLKFQAKK